MFIAVPTWVVRQQVAVGAFLSSTDPQLGIWHIASWVKPLFHSETEASTARLCVYFGITNQVQGTRSRIKSIILTHPVFGGVLEPKKTRSGDKGRQPNKCPAGKPANRGILIFIYTSFGRRHTDEDQFGGAPADSPPTLTAKTRVFA